LDDLLDGNTNTAMPSGIVARGSAAVLSDALPGDFRFTSWIPGES
jgi:hypothetical protein